MTDGHYNYCKKYFRFSQQGSVICVVNCLCSFMQNNTDYNSKNIRWLARMSRIRYVLDDEGNELYSDDRTSHAVFNFF